MSRLKWSQTNGHKQETGIATPGLTTFSLVLSQLLLNCPARDVQPTSDLTAMGDKLSWQALASSKRESILASLPSKWTIQSNIPSIESQKDVTGYVQQFLSKREIEITETDVVGIASKVSVGDWTAVETTEAFCHRASIAHQLVSRCHCPSLFRSDDTLVNNFPERRLGDHRAYDEFENNTN